ncbi:PaaI family thioesterase [Amycolatopsis sp., V23-08]|uniref:PaaI family thioesterase n=1 Tax=Amycolatopsis heterodermiae TaxID=3110235 RepID=A0ABU5RGF2_9PSEU|nr:PaaI family thioesterase [Amycolatopsis sp., V23-08]MEA5365351.1 PaaI family thioesterase [Amycolatopsis sp., V23-08]
MPEPTPRARETPPGFELLVSSPFVAQVGPIHVNDEGVLGVHVRDEHRNVLGTVHGGFLMTLADVAAGRTARRVIGEGAVVQTVSATVDFLSTAAVGSWLEIEATVDRAGRRAVFTTCRVTSGDKTIAKASVVLLRS